MHGRSFIRGISAGVVVKLLVTAIITALVGMVHAYAVAQNGSSPLREGAFPALSGGWYATQVLVMAGAVLSGFACAHWSKPGSWSAPVALALLWLAVSAAKLPDAQPLVVVLVRAATSSVGILLGAFLYQRREPTRDA